MGLSSACRSATYPIDLSSWRWGWWRWSCPSSHEAWRGRRRRGWWGSRGETAPLGRLCHPPIAYGRRWSPGRACPGRGRRRDHAMLRPIRRRRRRLVVVMRPGGWRVWLSRGHRWWRLDSFRLSNTLLDDVDSSILLNKVIDECTCGWIFQVLFSDHGHLKELVKAVVCRHKVL